MAEDKLGSVSEGRELSQGICQTGEALLSHCWLLRSSGLSRWQPEPTGTNRAMQCTRRDGTVPEADPQWDCQLHSTDRDRRDYD